MPIKKPIIINEEIKQIIVSVIVLGFAFSFRDWGSGISFLEVGIKNFITTTIIVGFSFFIHEAVHRWIAYEHNAVIRFKAWMTTWGIAILSAFITLGQIIFASVGAVSIEPLGTYRAKHHYAHLGPYERAKIALSGPLANVFLAVIAALMLSSGYNYFWSKMLTVNMFLAVFNLFPFFRIIPPLITRKAKVLHSLSKATYKENIPYIEGEMVFLGSRSLWAFSFSFTIILWALISIWSIIWSLITAFTLAFIIYILWQLLIEPKGGKNYTDSDWFYK